MDDIIHVSPPASPLPSPPPPPPLIKKRGLAIPPPRKRPAVKPLDREKEKRKREAEIAKFNLFEAKKARDLQTEKRNLYKQDILYQKPSSTWKVYGNFQNVRVPIKRYDCYEDALKVYYQAQILKKQENNVQKMTKEEIKEMFNNIII